MGEPMKPKRGWVYRATFDAYLAGPPMGGRIFGVDSVFHGDESVPVLVIPDPDRDPTPEEIEALAEALCATTAPGALDGPFAAMLREVVRAAWKLGARVPHA